MQKYWWLIPVLGVAISIGGVTVVRLQNDEPAATAEAAPLSVSTVAAAVEPIRAWVSSKGTVRAVEYQHLTFENEGEVKLAEPKTYTHFSLPLAYSAPLILNEQF